MYASIGLVLFTEVGRGRVEAVYVWALMNEL